MEYYPDVFLFELNQIQYTHIWNQLSTAKYLKTNGYEISPTNWFVYAFQTFKGWLGFQNDCHPQKVSYSLNKLAYYGYTKQFVQPEFTFTVADYSVSLDISTLVHQERNDLITEKLQNELISNFFKVEHVLNNSSSYQKIKYNHRFGDSWIKQHAYELIPQMDPQDDGIIEEIIIKIDQKGILPKEFVFFCHSKYARAAAQYYCAKAKNTEVPSFLFRLLWKDPRPAYLALALEYDPEIAKQDTEKFIEYHLKQKEYQSALNLMGILNDHQLIIKFLLKIPEVERNNLIQKDTPIAANMARYYLEKKQYPVAQKFYSNIEEIDPSVAFTINIQDKNYIKAYDIFKQNKKNNTFSLSDRIELAKVFFINAENEYTIGKSYRNNKQWKEAEQHYLKSLEQKKAAYHLESCQEHLENVYTHKRLYSLLLIDADIDMHKAEDSDVASIQKAIKLLRECHSNDEKEQCYQMHALATGLMRRADFLCEKISLPYIPPSLDEHKSKYQTEISTFIKTLNELILLLNGTKDKNLLLKLGKAHYLLADVQFFFDINAPDINYHYKMAMEAVPDNPFYLLRVSEIFLEDKEKNRERGVINLKNMGYTVSDFIHWTDERWLKKEKIIYDIKNIHPTI